LRNIVERVLLLATGEELDAATVRLALPLSMAGSAPAESGPLADRTLAFERETILAELRRHHFHMTKTARALGLERSHLYKKCQHLGIDLRAVRKTDK
jgi:DNA-binding NtrC family response regulator